MPLHTVSDFHHPQGYGGVSDAAERARHYCRQLEQGGILYFKGIPFEFPRDEIDFLLAQKQSGFKGHKNISYRPLTDLLRGDAGETPEASRRLREIMRQYSRRVTDFLGKFLSPYAGHWKLDFASYRPVEEQNRDLTLHKRNDLMHVDAFPSRPTRGGRILRVFTNINPERNRVWEVTEPFEAIARKYAHDAGLKDVTAATPVRTLLRGLAPLLKTVGLPGADRSAYDRFMLRFHDYLKENGDYQSKHPKERIEFPPGSTWLVYTDTVPHAVLSGQYALEQTYIIPMAAMVAPNHAPIRVLEEMVGRALAS
jgi:3-deoxy-D-manno-octulosonic acid hydroxylase-like protein